MNDKDILNKITEELKKAGDERQRKKIMEICPRCGGTGKI